MRTDTGATSFLLPPAQAEFLAGGDEVYCQPHNASLDLSLTHNPLGCSLALRDAISLDPHQISLYPELSLSTLRDALANVLGIMPESIAIGAGIDGLLCDLITTFSAPGDDFIVPACTFPSVTFFGRVRGLKPQFVPMTPQLRIDFSRLLDGVSRHTSFIYICNPNNPTGFAESIDDIIAIARSTKTLVIVDEANVEFADHSCVASCAEHDNLVVLRTFSKAYGLASLRVGYCIAAPALIRILGQCRAPFPVSTIGTELARLALNDKGHISASVAYVRSESEMMVKELSRLGYGALASGTNCFLCRAPGKLAEAGDFYKVLEAGGVAVVNGKYFGLARDYVRIAPQKKETNARFLDIAKQLLA